MSDERSLVMELRPRVYTVNSLTEEIKVLLESHFEFIWVEGEISNFKAPSSGHYYMSLKDEKAQIRAVMFRPQSRYLKFIPEDGMKVIARGRIAVYEPRGEYQIVLDYLEPLGVGALALAFEQLKRKLAAQGLFDKAIKKPLPFLPQRVAVITSPTGAAIRDFLRIIYRRFTNIEVIIVPVKVQGDQAATEIVEALRIVNEHLQVDVIVLTRGGGSLEDLWAFNQEELALAIRASRIPVVSAVGHEIDVTISDLVADLRAPTPSAAAELLVVEKDSLIERLREMRIRLQSGLKGVLASLNQRLILMSKGLRDPRKRLADLWLRLDDLHGRIGRVMGFMLAPLGQSIEFQKRSLTFLMDRRLKESVAALSLFGGKLKDMSPLSILRRGYSITRKLPEKKILKSSSGVEHGNRVRVTLAQGELDCLVEKVVES